MKDLKKDLDFGAMIFKLSESYHEIGLFHDSINFMAQAKQLYQRTNNKKYLVCLEALSSVYELQKEWQSIEVLFQEKLSENETLFVQNPNEEETRQFLAIAYVNLAMVEQQQKHTSKVDEYYKKVNQMFNIVPALMQDMSFKRDKMVAFERFALLFRAQNEIDKAIECLLKGESLAQQMCNEIPKNLTLRQNLVSITQFLGLFLHEKGDFDKAYTFFKRSYEDTLIIYNTDIENPQYKYNMALAIEKMGSAYEENLNYEQALISYKKCAVLLEEIQTEYPDIIDFEGALAIVYLNLGEVYFQLENWLETKEIWEKAAQIWERLWQKVGIQRYHQNLLEIQENLSYLKSVVG